MTRLLTFIACLSLFICGCDDDNKVITGTTSQTATSEAPTGAEPKLPNEGP
ncbi:MAG: hypothetical protein R3B84_23830 [Zavarzinella sp.]